MTYIGKGNCRVVVSMAPNFPATRANWWDIWIAAVAVETMCVQYGMAGTVYYIGKTFARMQPNAMAESYTCSTVKNFLGSLAF